MMAAKCNVQNKNMRAGQRSNPQTVCGSQDVLREENRDGKKLTEEMKKVRVARKGNGRAGTTVHNCTVFRVLTSSSMSKEDSRLRSWRQMQGPPNCGGSASANTHSKEPNVSHFYVAFLKNCFYLE